MIFVSPRYQNDEGATHKAFIDDAMAWVTTKYIICWQKCEQIPQYLPREEFIELHGALSNTSAYGDVAITITQRF